MLSKRQRILIKCAQREAGLSDEEYRDALLAVTMTCRSSTDPRLTDRHCDRILAYMEAIYWRGVETGTLQLVCKANAVFRKKGFWALRNSKDETSRDRYATAKVSAEIASLETALQNLGFGRAYCAAIRTNSGGSNSDLRGLYQYCAALKRTLQAKQNKAWPAASRAA